MIFGVYSMSFYKSAAQEIRRILSKLKKPPRIKKASIEQSLERKTSIITESSIKKLATSDITNAAQAVTILKKAYDENPESLTGIKIQDVLPESPGFKIIATNKYGDDLSFSITSYGNRMMMTPQGKLGKALWSSIVANAGNIANVLNIWSLTLKQAKSATDQNEVRVYSGPGSPTGYSKSASQKKTYVGSSLFEEVEKQQPSSNFVEMPAELIVPTDPQWVKKATIIELKKKFKILRKISSSLGENQFSETKKWATDWKLKIAKEIKYRTDATKLKKIAYKKLQDLKKLLSKIR